MKRYALLFLIIMLAMAGLACNVGGGGDDEADTTQSDTAQTEAQDDSTGSSGTDAGEQPPASEGGDDEPASSADQPADDAGDSGSQGMYADPDSLDSYRMRSTMTLLEGPGMGVSSTETEWVRQDQARHVTMLGEDGGVMMEMITVGEENWMNMGDGNWIHMPAADSAGINPADFQIDVDDILEDMYGDLDPDGTETVNGVKCKRYNVDTDFEFEMPVPEDANAAQFMPQSIEGHVTGQIWIADESGLPPVAIRSDTNQRLTLKYESREETMVYEEFREMYDINEPFTIDLPEGASEMAVPTAPEGQPEVSSPPEGAEPVATAGLDELDSYRLEWGSSMEMGEGGGMDMLFLEEWNSELNALRVVISMGEVQAGEYVWVGDEVWMNLGGGWMQSSEEDVGDMMSGRHDLMNVDEPMVFVGDKTVNGVNCKHYVRDVEAGGMKSHQEIWVANQGDLPPVVVRAILTIDTAGMVSTLEGNVTDINQPIEIELPQ